MTKYEFFLLTTQTLLVARVTRGAPRTITSQECAAIMSDAWKLDPACLPEDPAQAALDFVDYWSSAPRQRPKWLEDWEEERRNRVCISLNRATDARAWWMQAESLAEGLPPSCRDIVCERVEHIVVSGADADAFKSWGESIPGWEDAPFLFAPEPA